MKYFAECILYKYKIPNMLKTAVSLIFNTRRNIYNKVKFSNIYEIRFIKFSIILENTISKNTQKIDSDYIYFFTFIILVKYIESI